MPDLHTTVQSIFSSSGRLSRVEDFEYRPQQERMALAVAGALEERAHLIVEAPTGVGKTLAYLVPSLLFALREKRKAVVTTHTKNLQDQLIHKDLKVVRAILDDDFSAVGLKGRRNYLCTTRLRAALASTGSLFNKDETRELERIHAWSLATRDGDVESMDRAPMPEVWEMVCSEKDVCSSALCGSACFFQRAKDRTRSAALVVMNHALFFTLLALQESEEGAVYPNDFVVFDEAHTLEAVAGTGVGKRISRYQVMSPLRRLYNAKTRRGLLAREEKRVREACLRTERRVEEFFESVAQAAAHIAAGPQRPGGSAREVRTRTPGIVANTLDGPIKELDTLLGELERDATNELVKIALPGIRRSLQEAHLLVTGFLQQTAPSFTYWVELSGTQGKNVTLCASPSDIAETVGPGLFREDASSILTSATLSVGGSLDYYRRRIGATGVQGIIIDSPFDFQRQMRLFLPQGIPGPEHSGYAQALPLWILQAIERSDGRALALFTSAALMQSMAAAVEPALADRGIRLFVQSGGLGRHAVLQEFKSDVRSVLFGLESFWTGVDVPGEALEHVIITRLPFAVPNHPLIESRLERIAENGGNAFLDYTLPEAVLKLRQGVGRLIRSSADKGMITILDARILTKWYGKTFLASLPPCRTDILLPDGETVPAGAEEW